MLFQLVSWIAVTVLALTAFLCCADCEKSNSNVPGRGRPPKKPKEEEK